MLCVAFHTRAAGLVLIASVAVAAGLSRGGRQSISNEKHNFTHRDTAAWLDAMPKDFVLHAPYTPFGAEVGSPPNVSVIPTLAAHAAAKGVTTIWVAGSMGEFDALTIEERKALAAAWTAAARPHGLYVIVNVGTTVLAEAVELAQHAVSVGADAIAAVPPYYTTAHSVESVLSFVKVIAAAAPTTPFFYYHIPSLTKTEISVAQLFRMARDGPHNVRVPTLIGVKYVDTDMTDWLELVTTWNDTRVLMFAPEPKMQSFAIGLGRGTVLAEDFFAPTFLRMRAAYLRGDMVAARAEQQWKLTASATFGSFTSPAAERAVYRWLCGVDMGPPRLPEAPLDPAQLPQLKGALEAIGFFEKV